MGPTRREARNCPVSASKARTLPCDGGDVNDDEKTATDDGGPWGAPLGRRWREKDDDDDSRFN